MTFPEFAKFQDDLYAEISVTREIKGREYASSEDRFANFNRSAAKNEIHRLQAANVFLQKHQDSIDTFIKDIAAGRTPKLSEPIRGRFKDAILYLFLMAGMVEEEELGKGDTK